MSDQRITISRLGVAIGIVLLIASPALSLGQWYSNRAPLKTLAWFEQHRSSGDSRAFASAVYHAGYAKASNDRRWHFSGYATQGVAGTLVGLALVLAARPRRAEQP